ncbi:MAG: hypothetical protein ABIQ77_09115 [Anaerolineales bacterium]
MNGAIVYLTFEKKTCKTGWLCKPRRVGDIPNFTDFQPQIQVNNFVFEA